MNRNPLFIFGSVTFARIIYAMCWYDLTASFPAMSSHFHYSLEALGLFSTAFYVGNAAFQIPGGLISAQRGPKFSTILGLSIITLFSFVSILSGEFYIQAIARFSTGVGAAFVFAPAMIIAARALGRGRSGLAIGVYNSSFNVGAAIALVLFTPLSADFDWRLPFAITAVLTLVSVLENSYALEGVKERTKLETKQISLALASRDIWIALVSVLGSSAAFYVVTQFVVSYSENQLHFTPELAGLISSVSVIGAMLGSPIGGWLSDRFMNRRFFILVSGVGVAGAISLFSLQSASIAWVASFLSGLFFASANTNALSYPTQLGKINGKYVPLSVGMMNGLGTLAGSGYTTTFAELVLLAGYDTSWLLICIPALILSPLIYLAVEPYKTTSIEGN